MASYATKYLPMTLFGFLGFLPLHMASFGSLLPIGRYDFLRLSMDPNGFLKLTLSLYGAFAAGRDFCSIIITKIFKLI